MLATVQKNGKEVARADCVFEVAENGATIARMNNDTGNEKLVADYPQEEIDQVHIPLLRKLYINSVQLFSQHVYFSQHNTDMKEWDSPYPDALNHRMSAATARMWVRACRENGIPILAYTDTCALSPELKFDLLHPEWIIDGPLTFPESTKHLYAMWMYFHNMDITFPKGKPIIAPGLHYNNAGDLRGMTHYLAGDFARAVRRFGWDGYFFDSFSWALEDSAFGHDREGKPLNTLSSDDTEANLLSAIKAQVRAITGRNFVAVANFGLPAGLSPWHDEQPDLEDFRRNRAIYRKTTAQMGIFFLEQHPLPYIPSEKDPHGRFIYPQTLEDTVRALRLSREANDINVPVMLMPVQYISRLSETIVDANLLYSCSYASGVLLCMARGTLPRSLLAEPLSTNPLLAAEANYNKFAARYCEYLFDLNIRWASQEQVECSVPDKVWWKEPLSQRTYPDGRRDIYVHLINRPVVPLTWGEKMDTPQPLQDLAVSVRSQPGMRLQGVWRLSLNGNRNSQSLTPRVQDGHMTVVVPRLEYWTMLICSYTPVAARSNRQP